MSIPIDPALEPPSAPSGGGVHVQTADERGVSQGRLTLRRFLGHKPAVISAILFILIVGFAVSATGFGPIPGWWIWDYEELIPLTNGGQPTLTLFPFALGEHPFGQNTVGKDYFAMTMRGLVNSSYIMFIIGIIGAFIGVVIGAIAGYYRGWVDAVLMRMTDIVIVIPIIVIGAVVGSSVGNLGPLLLAIFLGFFAWTGIARLVRAEFLTLREREFVEAARVAGASDARIIFKHILPNAIGVVIVATTLLIAAAIILETSLSFLGYGVKSPDVSLGLLISQNESAFQTRPWLFWWPAAFIVILSLLVNFVGDGLRDAFDPRQKRIVFRKVKDIPDDAVIVSGSTADVPEGALVTAGGAAIVEGVSSERPADVLDEEVTPDPDRRA
jgi:peptide/nickel transport system permease protein